MTCQVVVHSIRLPRNSTISDVITDLKTKVITNLSQFTQLLSFSSILIEFEYDVSASLLHNDHTYLLQYPFLFRLKHVYNSHLNVQQVELSNPDTELRLLEVFYHKIYKVCA